MSEQKKYTAKDFRHAVFARQARMNAVPLVHPTEDELDEMLEQAADAEEENAQLKARLEAVVKIASDNSWCEDSGVVETDTCARLHNSYMSDILRAARGEGGAE